MEERTCIAIDLKSFYASVECIERGLDPMDTHLVVADKRRTEKTICLAVTPALKARGRARTAAAIRGRPARARHQRPAPARRAGTGVCRFVPQRRAVFALRGADGYGDVIRRASLKTDRRIDLTDEEERAINATLRDLLDAASGQPLISAVCFEPDGSREGGTYVALEGSVKAVDVFDQSILFTDGRRIPFKSTSELKHSRAQKRADT